MVPEAIEDRFDHIKDPDWIIYRCPHCNAWDYALQGNTKLTKPGIYTCDECGGKFEIKEKP